MTAPTPRPVPDKPSGESVGTGTHGTPTSQELLDACTAGPAAAPAAPVPEKSPFPTTESMNARRAAGAT